MAEPPADSDDESGSTPRWAKLLWGIVVALLLLFVLLHVSGNGLGQHGP